MKLDFLGVTTENVGPFAGQKLSVLFPRTSCLIKAPVGTGKSFLFFDAPGFALFGKKSRNLLNSASERGVVKLLFSVDGLAFLVVRELKKTKSGESVKNFLWQGSENLAAEFEQLAPDGVVLPSRDVQDFCRKNGLELTPVELKNNSDVQTSLDQLLGDLNFGVFGSVMFLQQDAENLFLKTPAQRLDLLKKLFLGDFSVDAMVEKLRDERSRVKWLVDALERTDDLLRDAKSAAERGLEWMKFFWEADANWTAVILAREKFVAEGKLELLSEDYFFGEEIEKKSAEIERGEQERWALGKSREELLEKKSATEQELATTKSRVETLKTELEKVGEKSGGEKIDAELKFFEEKIVAKKSALVEENRVPIEKSRALEILGEFWGEFGSRWGEDAKSFKKFGLALRGAAEKIVSERADAEQNLAKIRGQQQKIAEKIEALGGAALREKLAEKLRERWKNLDAEEKNLREKRELRVEREKSRQEKIANLKKNLESGGVEKCVGELQEVLPELGAEKWEKIRAVLARRVESGDRAGIEAELKKLEEEFAAWRAENSLEKLDAEIATIGAKKTEISELGKNRDAAAAEKLFPEIAAELEKSRVELAADAKSRENERQKIEENLKKIAAKKMVLETFLGEISWEKVDEKICAVENLESEIAELDEKIKKIWAEKSQLVEQEKRAIAARSELGAAELRVGELEKVLEKNAEELEKIEKKLAENPRDRAREKSGIQLLRRVHEQLAGVWEKFGERAKEIAALDERLKIVEELGKSVKNEFVMFVLRGEIANLERELNRTLGELVDYEVSMEVKNEDGTVEMPVKIRDQHGEREVKSLSGGQQTLLQLAWMMTVANYFESALLFLDETINHLDQASVARVSELIFQFVGDFGKKFFLVTHNPEVQKLPVRKKVVDLEEIVRK